MDEILKQAAQAQRGVDPALLDRIAGVIGSSLGPVRPLPSRWVLAGGLALVSITVALAGGALFGLRGLAKLSVTERAAIFPVLAILILVAAGACIREMIPGSPRRFAPGHVLAAGSLALPAVFALLFGDYRTDRFVSQGLVCLAAGLVHAIPVGVAIGWLLRRGLVVNRISAGVAAGTLAGLAGVSMLELHCANFEAPHVTVWHTAVMLISAAVGALVARRAGARGGT